MKTITAAELASAVSGVLLSGAPDTPVPALCSDSRTIAAGECFLPLKGERDGHDFIDHALAAGAAGCLCENVPENRRSDKFYIRVPDTLLAYKALAAWYRSAFSIPVVQVTGSTGKTTTKEMIASVLAQHMPTLKTEANYNNEIGTPLTLLRLAPEHGAAVIETGMTGAGEIRYLGEMVLPTIAVITNIGDMHIEYLGSRAAILAAKCEIFDNLAPEGLAVLNGDDPLLNTVQPAQRTVRVGKGQNCAVRISDIIDNGLDGIRCTVSSPNARYALEIPAPGAYMVYPAAIAIAVGEELGLSASEILRGVAAYQPAGARMRVIRLNGGRCVLDDCYNAGPQSVRAALQVLSKNAGRRVAILGDMAELGSRSVSAHREIGALTQELGIESVIAIGVKAKDLADAARAASVPADRADRQIQWYATVEEALDAVRASFQENTTVLVKASHSMRFERVTEALTGLAGG